LKATALVGVNEDLAVTSRAGVRYRPFHVITSATMRKMSTIRMTTMM
jgi:hypothetical protein